VLSLVSGSLVVVVVGSVVFGLGLPWLMIGFSTFLQRNTPRPLMGRVSTAVDLVMGLPNTLSIAAGALLIAVVDYRILLVVAAAGLLGAGASLLRDRRLDASRPAASDVVVEEPVAGTAVLPDR